jgi:hypothetical protein
MNRVLAMLSLFTALCCAVPGAAACRTGIFADFSGSATSYDGLVSRADPDSFTVFSVYLGVLGLPMWYSAEIRSIGFRLRLSEDSFVYSHAVTPPGVSLSLLSGEWGTGRDILVEAGSCLHADAPWTPLYFARIYMWYLGVPDDIEILPQSGGFQGLHDCDGYYGEWCVYSQAGVCKPALPGESGCVVNSPVSRCSWGTIKALYR